MLQNKQGLEMKWFTLTFMVYCLSEMRKQMLLVDKTLPD